MDISTYQKPETKKHESKNIVQGSLYYVSLYKSGLYYYEHYYTSLYR